MDKKKKKVSGAHRILSGAHHLVGTHTCMRTGYLVHTGVHPVHFGLLCLCVEMTVVDWNPLYDLYETQQCC